MGSPGEGVVQIVVVVVAAVCSFAADLILTRERDCPSFGLLYFNSSRRAPFLSKILVVSVVLLRLIFVSELLRTMGVFG